jgi:hypothetical protein
MKIPNYVFRPSPVTHDLERPGGINAAEARDRREPRCGFCVTFEWLWRHLGAEQ